MFEVVCNEIHDKKNLIIKLHGIAQRIHCLSNEEIANACEVETGEINRLVRKHGGTNIKYKLDECGRRIKYVTGGNRTLSTIITYWHKFERREDCEKFKDELEAIVVLNRIVGE